MKIAAATLLLLLSAPAYAETSCALGQLASVDMSLGKNGELVVPVTLGQERVPFVIDTRAPRSVVFHGTVARLGLIDDVGSERPIDVDGTLINGRTRVPMLVIGDLHTTDASFAVTTNAADGTNGSPAGVIGADFLRYYDVEIDPAAGKFKLFSQDHCEGKVVYWAKSYNRSPMHLYSNGQVEMDVELNGVPLHALLATGTGSMVIEESAARRHFGIDVETAALSAAEPIADLSGKALPVYRYDFNTLKFGDLTINHPQIGVAPVRTPWVLTSSHVKRDLDPDVLVGMNFLRRLHLYIAYREDEVYYTVEQ